MTEETFDSQMFPATIGENFANVDGNFSEFGVPSIVLPAVFEHPQAVLNKLESKQDKIFIETLLSKKKRS